MLKLHAKKLDAAEVLSLEGQIVIGQTEILCSAVQSAGATRDIILDLSNVRIVDAHGLGVLLKLREQALAKGVHFELINVSQPLRRIFEITRLDTVFEINRGVDYFPRVAYAQQLLVAA
jgi:anti-sigma B factor antagonist